MACGWIGNPGIAVRKFIGLWKTDYMMIFQRLQLAADARRLKKDKTDEAHIAFHRKRQALDIRIEKHQDKADRYLPPRALDDIHHSGDDVDDGWIDNEWKDIADDGMEIPDAPFSFSFPLTSIPTEMIQDTERKVVLLPSTIGHDRCLKLGLQSLIQKEVALREGQANDSLQAIRLAIGEKSFRFRKQLRLAGSKKKKTRSWDGIHVVGKRLQHHRLVYRQARDALSRLGVPPETLQSEFRELTDDDLRTSTAVMEPNARGQRKAELSWIWQQTGMKITNQTSLVNECECRTLLIPIVSESRQYIVSIGCGQDLVVTDGWKNSPSRVTR
jgi:hypothetical protein